VVRRLRYNPRKAKPLGIVEHLSSASPLEDIVNTSELITQPSPTNRDVLIVGSAAGIIAGIGMAMWAALTSVWHGVDLLSSFEMIGATLTGHTAVPTGLGSAFYGVMVHAATSAGLGILFTAFLPVSATTRFATRAGLLFGIAVLITMTFVVTPLVNPALHHGLHAIPKSWIIQHVIFGATLGVVPSLWRWYVSDDLRVRFVQAGRRSVIVRRPQLPALPPVVTFPRIARARTALRRSDILGVPQKAASRQ
jgi:hypothetical protein